MKKTIVLVILAVMLAGCRQSEVTITVDPNGAVTYRRVGDIETQDVNAILPDGSSITFSSSKSENTAYREGVQAAKDVAIEAIDQLWRVK